jgi:hypothetical protein
MTHMVDRKAFDLRFGIFFHGIGDIRLMRAAQRAAPPYPAADRSGARPRWARATDSIGPEYSPVKAGK